MAACFVQCIPTYSHKRPPIPEGVEITSPNNQIIIKRLVAYRYGRLI